MGVGGCAAYQHVSRCMCAHKPREFLHLAHNQCLSLQDVIAITQQVAMEKSLIRSQTESTITRGLMYKGYVRTKKWRTHFFTSTIR